MLQRYIELFIQASISIACGVQSVYYLAVQCFYYLRD